MPRRTGDPQESEHTGDGEARKDPADGEVTKKNKKKRRRNRKKKVKSLAIEDNESTNPPTAVALLDAEKNTPKSINTLHSTTIPPDPLYNPNYPLPYRMESSIPTQLLIEATNTEGKNGSVELLKKVVGAVMEENAHLEEMAKANKKELRELMGKMAEGKNTIEKLSQEITSLRDARKEDSKEIAMLTEHMK